MKLTKKKVLLASLAVCLVAIVSFGTLAWFTAEDTVVNEFYVGNTTTDPDEVFGIDLWERVDGIDYGRNTADTEGAKYEEILPGQALDKDPYLTNTGIHPMYVRAVVTVTDAGILKDAMIPRFADHSEWYNVDMFLPGTGDKWSLEHKYYTNDDTFVFVYYYTEVLEPASDSFDGTTQKLFDDVVIPTELTKEQAALMDNFTITIVGEAIQSEHLDPNVIAEAEANGEVVAKAVFAKYYDEPGAVAGVYPEDLANEDDTVSVSYPVTGNLGNIKNDLIQYDPANYTDPDNPGALIMNGVTASIEDGANLVVIPADQMNVTVIISDTDYTVAEGSKIVDCPHGTGAIYVSNVTINGEKITWDNYEEMSEKYFSGLDLYLF